MVFKFVWWFCITCPAVACIQNATKIWFTCMPVHFTPSLILTLSAVWLPQVVLYTTDYIWFGTDPLGLNIFQQCVANSSVGTIVWPRKMGCKNKTIGELHMRHNYNQANCSFAYLQGTFYKSSFYKQIIFNYIFVLVINYHQI